MQTAGILLYLGASIGHVAILSYSLNWWYGLSLHHHLLFAIRQVHGLAVLVGLVAFWPGFGYDFLTIHELHPGLSRSLVASIYTLGCVAVGLGVVPLITLRRWLRPKPAVLLSNHTQTVDVAARLGYKPVGRGPHQLLARLPGNEAFQVDLAERTICLPRLPAAWEGLTILHLSDLHLRGTPDRTFFDYVMDLCRAWEPDLVAITGDVVDSKHHHRWILPVLGRLRWRVAAFGVLGNHDFRYGSAVVRRRLSRLGIHVLGNSWQELDVRGQPLVVVGHEGPWLKPAPDLTTCPKEPFRLCLSHTPDNIRWAREQNIDLMLAGHVHGGQVRFPVIGSVLVPSTYSRRYDCGTFHEPPTVLHVSRGLSGQQPVRYNCRPEATKLVLKKQG